MELDDYLKGFNELAPYVDTIDRVAESITLITEGDDAPTT